MVGRDTNEKTKMRATKKTLREIQTKQLNERTLSPARVTNLTIKGTLKLRKIQTKQSKRNDSYS